MSHATSSPCLDDETLQAFAEGMLSPAARARVDAHLDACAACRHIVGTVAAMTGSDGDPEPGRPAPSGLLLPGAEVLRYRIVRTLGLGGGGIVYEALDPQLRRKVSLKLLRPVPAEGLSTVQAEERLLREAQAMARLSHPNVVAVYDVGTFDGRIVIVLEHVEGLTLTQWLRDEPRDVGAILRAFVDAGRGLAAAHDAGLVHRDFKPDNVLVGHDGRVRVTDFGLARALGAAAFDAGASRSAAGAVGDGAAGDATTTALAGTPVFMAPEQLQGRRADTRADQFAFCVALHWALYGTPPTLDRLRPEHARVVVASAPRSPSASGGDAPPEWLREAIARGLAARPEDRYPDMHALLAALRPDGSRRRRWLPIAAAAAMVAIAVVWGARTRSGGEGAAERVSDARGTAARTSLASVRQCGAPPPGAGVVLNEVDGDCAFVFDEPLAWRDARQACVALGSVLFQCDDRVECRHVESALSPGLSYWIGLHYQGMGGPRWTSDLDVIPYLIDERLREAHAPGRDCVAIVPAPDPVVQERSWSALPCGERHGYVCARAAWAIWRANGHAYMGIETPMSWDEARAHCAQLDAELVSITSADEQAFIEERFLARGSNAIPSFWIGATDREREGDFRWTTGEPFAYQAFHPNEPDNRDGEQNCLVLNPATWRWHDRACGVRYPALCERRERLDGAAAP